MLNPNHDGFSEDFPSLSAQEELVEPVSVARVRPKASTMSFQG